MADKVKCVEERLIQDCFPWRTFRAMPLPFAASFLPNWYPMWTTTFAPARAENTELWSDTGLPIFLTCQFAQTSTTGDRCDYKYTVYISIHYTPIITNHVSPFSWNYVGCLSWNRKNCLVGSLRQILWWKWCRTRNAGSKVFWLFQATWQRRETAIFRDGSDSSMCKPLTEVFLAWLTIFGMGQQGIFSTWARKLHVPQSFKRHGVCLLRRKRAGSDTKLARLQAAFGLSCLPRLVHHHWDCRRPPAAEIERIPFLPPWASHMHSGAAVHSQMIRYVAFSTPSKSFRIFILPFCHTLPLSIRLNYRRIVWQSSTFCITFQDSKLLIYCKWVIPRSSQSLQASSRLQLWKEHQFARQTPFHHFSIWFIMFHLYNNSCVSLHNFCLFTSTSRRGPWLVVLPLCLSFDGLAQRSPWSPKRCVEKETSRANKDVGETSDNEVEWIEDVMPSHF